MGSTHGSQQGLLAESPHQAFGVHLPQPEHVEGPAVCRGRTGGVSTAPDPNRGTGAPQANGAPRTLPLWEAAAGFGGAYRRPTGSFPTRIVKGENKSQLMEQVISRALETPRRGEASPRARPLALAPCTDRTSTAGLGAATPLHLPPNRARSLSCRCRVQSSLTRWPHI